MQMSNKMEDYLFIFTHGAGAGIESDFMKGMVRDLNMLGLQTIPFNFPYMKIIEESGKRRPPDRMPKLIQAFKDQIEIYRKKFPNKRLVIGGKSMGGRVASLVTSEIGETNDNCISACICLGFPFHPPHKQDKYRGDHLSELNTPTLILQGERDTFGTRSEVNDYRLSSFVTVNFIPDGDHSFKPRVRSGRTLKANIELSVKKLIEFVVALKVKSELKLLVNSNSTSK